MTNEQRSEHYALKHPQKEINSEIVALLRKFAHGNSIDCATAHHMAKKLNIPPQEVGAQIDLIELKLVKCQLGIFGYGKGVKKFNFDLQLNDIIRERIEKEVQNCRISCAQCWKIATQLHMKRSDIASACEKLKLKIISCQLGAF